MPKNLTKVQSLDLLNLISNKNNALIENILNKE